MITELFVNSCFSLVLNKNIKIKRTKSLFRDIFQIIQFYEEKEKSEIPINIKNKLSCLKEICDLKLKDQSSTNAIDSVVFSDKFNMLQEFLTIKSDEEIEDSSVGEIISAVRGRKKLSHLFSNYDELTTFLDKVRAGSFDSADKLISDYEIYMKGLYSSLMESSRAVEVEASASLDIMKDDYSGVVNLIKKKYSKENTVPTGFTFFDNEVLKGGFEKGRLYLFGGGSGSGKSTLLMNFIKNSLISNEPMKEEDKDKKKVHVYITLENLVDESLMRLYMNMYGKTDVQFLREINDSKIENAADYLKKQVLEKITRKNRDVIFRFYPKFSISPVDIMTTLDDIISEYGKDAIELLYIDYLDLLKLDNFKYGDMYRLELSMITSYLKDIAVMYNIPVITLSQLTREVYTKNMDASELNLAMMSESIKKVEHTDFAAIMVKDKYEDIVHMNIGKNRSGPKDISLNFNVDFKTYTFLDCYVASNKDKEKTDSKNGNRGTSQDTKVIDNKAIKDLNDYEDTSLF